MKFRSLKATSLRNFIGALGLFVAMVTTVAIPAGYFAVQYSATQNDMDFQAKLKANRVAKYIYSQGALWQYHNVRLAELIDVPEAGARDDQQRIVDAVGKLIVEIGTAPQSPTMRRAAPIVVDGQNMGRMEVVASARPLLINTGIAAALSGLLGIAMFFAIPVFLLRVLNRALRMLQNTQAAALNNMSQGLVMFDAAERVVVCNNKFIEMYDLSPAVVKPGCSLRRLLKHRAERGHLRYDPDEYRVELLARLSLPAAVNSVVGTADGREISIASRPMSDGGWVVTHEDITERRKTEAKISHMALHDALTNLPNRLFFQEQIENRLNHLSRDQSFALLCLDLDGFKTVNDTLGHAYGDKLLRQVAERMSRCLREGDSIARMGGDEFAIVQGIKQPNEAITLADRLGQMVGAPFDLDGHHVVVGVSVGIAIAPTDATDADQLLRNADMALYRAKADGRGTYRFFEPAMDAMMRARRALEVDLRKALANGEFELYYQPIVNLEKENISGFEALIRWNHPERGLVPPLDFIPLAEETALIVPIGEWVLRQACSEAVKWPDAITIAVNLSAAQFKARNLPQMVAGALAQSGLAAQRLELEITESVLLVGSEATLQTLHLLRDRGVRISMDDFGTGYSSLSYLRSFPFDKIKIDRSFVHDLASNPDSKAIIRAVTGLGSSLGIITTGEGVETQEELEYLKREGCTEAQGYFFSKPKPAREVYQILSKQGMTTEALA